MIQENGTLIEYREGSITKSIKKDELFAKANDKRWRVAKILIACEIMGKLGIKLNDAKRITIGLRPEFETFYHLND